MPAHRLALAEVRWAIAIGVWPLALTVGEALPVLPLWLREVENPVRVDLEAGYTEARQRGAIG